MDVTSRKKNISTLIILAVVLLVPGFLYVLMNKIGTNEYLKLPIYGDKVLSGKMNRKMGRDIPDTLFHTVGSMRFIDEKGDSLTFRNSDTIISVAHLFYAKDTGLSKGMLDALRPVVTRFKQNNRVKFYSISVDKNDSSTLLNSFAIPYNKNFERNWHFVQNSTVDLLAFAKEQLLIDAMKDPADTSKYLISNNYVLIDTKGRIRGFYDLNLKTELDRLEDEIKVQMVEEIRNNPLKVEKK